MATAEQCRRTAAFLKELAEALESGRPFKIDANKKCEISEPTDMDRVWLNTKYRVVYEPRELFVNRYPGGSVSYYNTMKDADTQAAANRVELIRFVEDTTWSGRIVKEKKP